ncbi:MAG: GntR family transcriptional regulator [Chloroflexi bacterium]|jgi:GntR family transcriptional regulator|nr:GntR family transcriptional regulator [Chloroflexota bacterium]
MLKSGPVPRYYQLKEIIRQKVTGGQWAPGTPIPSERELCEQYGLSRMTARQSITELVNEGYLYREQGKGTFVAQPKITQQLIQLTGFTEDMEARAKHPATQVLKHEMVPADAVVATALRIKPGQLLFRVQRLRLANGEPLAIETSLVNFIGCEHLMDEDLEHESLYQILEKKYGQPPLEADQELEARLAGEEEARLLKIGKGDPVLHIHRTTYTDRNQPLEFAKSIYRGDKYRFYTRLNRK